MGDEPDWSTGSKYNDEGFVVSGDTGSLARQVTELRAILGEIVWRKIEREPEGEGDSWKLIGYGAHIAPELHERIKKVLG